ncbi:unnamed protein product [Ranitomeya imitator]|uniref:X-box-binding protein 1 n=1 Tax=Ranitomeya imitator TaxID=111125 RepID=A0ABN9LN10_9NEOB|nr:unnamed protein product [Ranitomeya imitator]
MEWDVQINLLIIGFHLCPALVTFQAPDMVVMGAPKVIFIPGNQSEQSDCNSLASIMLPIHSPSSPESASGDVPPRKRQRLTHLTPEEKALRSERNPHNASAEDNNTHTGSSGQDSALDPCRGRQSTPAPKPQRENKKRTSSYEVGRPRTATPIGSDHSGNAPGKLKNRVAAQTARDRKKARMSELEQQVLDLELENEKLLIENKLLREKSHGLLTENQELRQRLGLEALEVKDEEVEVLTQSREDEVRPVTGSAESAALRLCAPLQQEQAQMSPNLTMSAWILTALILQTSDILLGLLESLDSDMLLTYEENLSWNQQEIKEVESDSIPSAPSSPLGTPSIKLEAINELIKFDHVYTKPVCSEQDSEIGIETNIVIKTEEASLNPSCIAPINVKQESQEDDVPPVVDTQSFLLSAEDIVEKPASLLETGSDSGYEGCTSPLSDMSSPLNSDQTWEDSFTTELFPQLLNVHMHQSCSPLGDPTLFWNPSPDFDDESF